MSVTRILIYPLAERIREGFLFMTGLNAWIFLQVSYNRLTTDIIGLECQLESTYPWEGHEIHCS